MGGSFGVALYGAVLIARLDILFADLPGAADIARLMGGSPGVVLLHGGRHALDALPAALHDPAITAIGGARSEEHTSELQSLMRHSYAVFCLKKKNKQNREKSRRMNSLQKQTKSNKRRVLE